MNNRPTQTHTHTCIVRATDGLDTLDEWSGEATRGKDSVLSHITGQCVESGPSGKSGLLHYHAHKVSLR